MLTLWLPDYPPALPSAAALHQIGTGALVKNDKREVKIISVLRRRRTVDDLSAKDEMCKNITDVCIPGHQQHYGFTACQAMLKPDVKLMDFARDEGCVWQGSGSSKNSSGSGSPDGAAFLVELEPF